MKRLIHIFISCVVLLGVGSCVHEDFPAGADIVKVGQMLPDFSVTMSDGTVVTGDMLRGGVSVVVFFDTSCPDCQQLLPELQRLYEEYSERVHFVLISREEGDATISSFWALHNLTMPYSAQSDRAVYNLFAESLIPRVYISDAEGIIRHIFADSPVPSYDTVRAALLGVL